MTALSVILLVVAGVLLMAPFCAWLDKRGDRRDAETWSEQPGAVRGRR